METSVSIDLDINVSDSTWVNFEASIDKLKGKFNEAWSDPFATFKEQASKSLDDLGKAWGKTLEKGWNQGAATLGSAITDSISPFFDGEMDKVEAIWDKAWEDMANVVDSVLNGLVKDAFTELADYAGQVFKDLVASPVKDWLKESLGIKNGLGDLVRGASSSSSPAGDVASLLGGGGGKKLLSQAGDYLLDSVGSLFSGSAAGAIGSEAAIKLGLTSAQGGLTETAAMQLAGPMGYMDTVGGELASFSSDMAAINAEISAGESFMSSIGGGAGLAAVGGGLMAFDALVRFMPGGDPEGLMGGFKKTIGAAFGLTELDSLDPARAKLKYDANQDYLGRVAGLGGNALLSSDVAESAQGMEVYAGVMGLSSEEMDLVTLGLTGLNEQMAELQLNLAEAARLGDEEMTQSLLLQEEELAKQAEQLMAINQQYGIGVEGLGQQNAAMVELSAASEQMALSLDTLGEAYERSHDHKMDEAEASQDLLGYYQELADQVDTLSEGAVVLGEDAEALVGQFITGQLSAEEFSNSMQEKLLSAMRTAQEEGKLLAEQMNSIAEAIRGIPTEWSSTVTTNYVNTGAQPGEHHSGGYIFHSGGRAPTPLMRIYGGMTRYHGGAYVSRLAHDEVPAVLQRGEFVVQRDSVNAATLPELKAINQSGRSGGGEGAVININAPLVQVEGNLIGDEDSKEDLVREIETRLRSLAESRFRP